MSDDQPDGPPDLLPVSLTHKPIFDAAFGRLAQPISDYSFANLLIWRSSVPLYWTTLSRHLCVFAASPTDLTMMLPPLPGPDARGGGDLHECLFQAFDLMDHYNRAFGCPGASRIEYVSDEMLEAVQTATGRGLSLSAAPMSGDFIYPATNMVHLAGGSLKSKRHARSKFTRDFPDHRVANLEDHHLPDCFALLDLWQHHADDAHVGQLTEDDAHVPTATLRHRETVACRVALEHRHELGLVGMVLYVGDNLAGFTLGQPLSPAQASILFEKTHPDFHGSAQFIFSEFCRLYWAEFPEINVGDDWGIPSLRTTKESYRPSRRLNKYSLTKPQLAPVLVPVPATHSVADPPPNENVADVIPPPTTLPPSATDTPSWPSDFDSTVHHFPCPTVSPTISTQPIPPLRVATLADVSAIVHLEHICFDLGDAFNLRQVRSLIRNQRAVCLVAESDGEISGWCVALIRQHRTCRSGRVYSLAVHPRHRGRGLGQLLARQVIDQLTQAAVNQVYLEVDTENTPAIRLYNTLGFQAVRRLPGYYVTGHDALSMRLNLEPPTAVDNHDPRFANLQPHAHLTP